MLRRIYEGRSIMSPDRGHFHHRLVDYGFSHKATVLILYAVTLICCTIAISIAVNNLISALIIVALGFVLFVMIISYSHRIQNKDVEDEKLKELINNADNKREDL